jgi:hypothetical protein
MLCAFVLQVTCLNAEYKKNVYLTEDFIKDETILFSLMHVIIIVMN